MPERYHRTGGQFHLHTDIPKLHKVGVFDEDGEPVMKKGKQVLREEVMRDADGKEVQEEIFVHASAEVAVAFTRLPDRIHIFTHGTAEGMKEWAGLHNAHSKHKAELHVFDQSTPEEVLNAAIRNPEELAKLL